MSARGRAAGILFSRPRPGCGFFVFLPAAGTVGLSAQLAYKNSFPFRKHRNSRPPICVSGPFHLQKLVVALGNRNWSRDGRDIDPLSKSIILHIHLLYSLVVFSITVCYYNHIVITVLLTLILGSSLRANIPDNEPQLKMDLLRIPGKESPFCVSSATQKGVFLL